MKRSYIKLVATKLSQDTHDRLRQQAMKDRRTLSGLSRIIIEDYVNGLDMKLNSTKE